MPPPQELRDGLLGLPDAPGGFDPDLAYILAYIDEISDLAKLTLADALNASIGTATEAALGLIKTSDPPDVAGQPFAVSISNNSWKQFSKIRFLNAYASVTAFNAAHVTAGYPIWELFVSTPHYAVNTTGTLHQNVHVNFIADGSFDVADGFFLTINSLAFRGHRTVFYGDVRLAKGATDGTMDGRWWIPEPTSGTPNPEITWKMIDGMRWSLYLSGGAFLILPSGEYITSAYMLTPNGCSIISYGAEANGVGGNGCIIRPQTGPFIKLVAGSRQTYYRGFGVDMVDAPDYSAFLFEGQPSDGNSCTDHTFDQIKVENGRSAIRAHSIESVRNGGWQVTGIRIRDCNFINQTVSCLEGNTVNNSWFSSGNSYSPSPNGTSSVFRFLGCGGLYSDGTDFYNGFNKAFPQYYSLDFSPGDVTTGAGTKVTKTLPTKADASPVFWTGQPVYIKVLAGSGGVVPTGHDPEKREFVRVSGSDLSFHPTAVDAFADTNREQWSTTGTGPVRIWSIEPIEAGWPHSILYTDGAFNILQIHGAQAEGFPRVVYVGPNTAQWNEGQYQQTIVLDGTSGQGLIELHKSVTLKLRDCVWPIRSIVDRPDVSARVFLDNVQPQQYIDGATYYHPGSLPLITDRDIMNVLGPQIGVEGTTVVTIEDGVTGESLSGNVLAGRDPVIVSENIEAEFDAGTIVNTQGNADDTLTLANAANGTTKAVRFEGSRTNQILVPHNAVYNITGDITIEAWVKLENPRSFSIVISKGDSGGPFDFVVSSGGQGSGWVRFGQSGTYVRTEGSAYLKLNQWQHIAVTKSGGSAKFYFNGVLVHTEAFAPTVVTDTDGVYIGHAPDTAVTAGYIFRGSLYDVRLWNVARSAAEIAANFNTVTPSGSGLVGQWKMQEGTGTSIADSSATANNGTLSGLDYTWQTHTQNYSASGNRISPIYDISTAKTISTSVISWVETKPTGHTTLIETRYSTDGGTGWSAWATATNGSAVPGLSGAVDLSNGRLQIRETLTSPTSKASPIISSVTVSFTTPVYQYNVGARTSAPLAIIDAGINTIQGKTLDTGGAYVNITAPRYGAIADDGLSDDAAFALALADLGPPNVAGSTGRIVFPQGQFDFDNDLEIDRVIVLEGAGGDDAYPGTTLSFADGKGVKVPAAELLGGYGVNGGYGKGSVVQNIKIVSKGKANAPTATVNVSGLGVTRTAGVFFQYEKWGGGQVVKIGGGPLRIANWLTDTTATLDTVPYNVTVSGAVLTLANGNSFPTGLTSGTVLIGASTYTISASTATTITLTASPSETGSRTIKITSFGTFSAQTMTILVNHGIEAGGTVHLRDVSVIGFAGNGVDINTANWNYENARNANTFTVLNVLSKDNEGHGFFVLGSNSNASSSVAANGFNNKGCGIYDNSQFGNTWIGPHTDSNRMEPFLATSASTIIGQYSEGGQIASRFYRSAGSSGPVVIGGFHGAGIAPGDNATIIDDVGSVRGLALAAGTLVLSSSAVFSGVGDIHRRISFGYSIEGAITSATIQETGGDFQFVTNTQKSGGAWGLLTNPAVPAWLQIMGEGSDTLRWYRAPATAGVPAFDLLGGISGTGILSGKQISWLNGATVTNLLTATATLNFGSIASNAVAELTVAIPGASDYESVIVTPRGLPEAGLIWSGVVSAVDTVTIRLANITGSAIDPALRDWRVTVIRF